MSAQVIFKTQNVTQDIKKQSLEKLKPQTDQQQELKQATSSKSETKAEET